MCTVQSQNPAELLAKARQGNGESLGALLQFYRNYLYLLARTQIDLHLQARANPSDLVQETFLQACSHFHQFRGSTEKELLAWLRRILVHNLARLVEKQILAQKRNVRREVIVMTPELIKTNGSASGLSRDQSSRVIRILEGYLGKLEQGCPPHPDDLVAEYPELGDTLRAYLDKLALLHNAATGLRNAT